MIRNPAPKLSQKRSNLLSHEFPELFSELVSEVETLPSPLYVYSKSILRWRVTACGHEFMASPVSRVRSKNHCKVCPKKGFSVSPGENDLATLHPELLGEWSSKNGVSPSEVSAYSHRKVLWLCSEDHEWEAPVYSRSKHGNGCGRCSNQVRVEGVNDLYTLLPQELQDEWSSQNSRSLKDSSSSGDTTEGLWECGRCSTAWRAPVYSRYRGWRRCPNCFNGSHLESIVAFFLESEGLRFHYNHRPLRVSENGRENLQLDFWLIDHPLAFEVQDFATHSRGNEDTVQLRWGGGRKKDHEYHETKRTLAREQLGVTLVDLWEDEVRNGSFMGKIRAAVLVVGG